MHVKKVLELLKQQQLYLNQKKCEFWKWTLLYLGFVVYGGEIQINPDKVKVIKDWPRSRSVMEVRSFMGAC